MVAINALSLLTLLPALAIAAAVPGHGGSSNHIARSGAHGRHRGIAARAVGSGAQHRPRRRGELQCRPRPATTTHAPPDAAPTPAAKKLAADIPPPQQDDSATAPQEGFAPQDDATAPSQDNEDPPSEDGAAPPQDDATPPPQDDATPPKEDVTPPQQTIAPPQADVPAPTSEQPAPPTETSPPPAPEAPKDEQLPEHNGGSWSNAGLLYATGPCGDNQPDAENPNGQQWWFNCGINEGGWNPPFLKMDQVKFVDYETTDFFGPCQPYKHIFNAVAAQYGVPPTFIAAIAMQESTCNPHLTGGAGEQGMMQLVGVNCDGAPNGDCKDVWFNIHSGTRYLREMTDQNGGSLLLGLGAYNGWHKGMTRHDVQVKADTWGCYAQQNLDYMQEFLNGWLQGKEGWKLATIKNREACH